MVMDQSPSPQPVCVVIAPVNADQAPMAFDLHVCTAPAGFDENAEKASEKALSYSSHRSIGTALLGSALRGVHRLLLHAYLLKSGSIVSH
jgi:hypothetical protein